MMNVSKTWHELLQKHCERVEGRDGSSINYYYDLTGQRITQESIRDLILALRDKENSIKEAHTVTLTIGFNSIGIRGCRDLSRVQWQNLKELNLYNNMIRDKGCRFLSTTPTPNLTRLIIWKNQITEKGCLFLIRGHWPYLLTLNVAYNYLGEKGCMHLSKGCWPKLEKLDLYDVGMCRKGYLFIESAFKCEIKCQEYNKTD